MSSLELKLTPFSLFLLQGVNDSVAQSSGVSKLNCKETEVPKQLPQEKADLKLVLSQPLPVKDEPVKGTHEQLDCKNKPTTPGDGFLL